MELKALIGVVKNKNMVYPINDNDFHI